jgi:Rrf2 family iron-sulfur cluster assembly transcriptional regulator
MKLNTQGRYAVTALLDLVLHQEEAPFSLTEIAKRQNIPQAYLERLAGQLRAKGLLVSLKGPGGGYLLGLPPEKITVADVILAVDESLDTTRCQGHGDCQAGLRCLTHHLWDDLNKTILDHLHSITLADLAKRHTVKEVAKRQDTCHLVKIA